MDRVKVKNRRFPKDFRAVAKYIKHQRGINVRLGDDTDYLGPWTREIVIHHNYDLRHNGLFILLFECGKAMKPFNVRNRINKELHPREYNLHQYLMDVESWELGYEIVNELELKVDFMEYYKFRTQHLTKYFSDKV